jgi:hypothetical protein
LLQNALNSIKRLNLHTPAGARKVVSCPGG